MRRVDKFCLAYETEHLYPFVLLLSVHRMAFSVVKMIFKSLNGRSDCTWDNTE
jgi:hypothetical protein